jgi:uncharacterized DUF497 family protein
VDVPFDPAKDRRNRRKHGIPLARAAELDIESARLTLDDREDYGEDRWVAIGFLDARLYVLTFTFTNTGIRAISLRRAEREEEKIYDQG